MAHKCKYNNKSFKNVIRKHNDSKAFGGPSDKASLELTDLKVCAGIQDVETFYKGSKKHCNAVTFADKDDNQYMYQTACSKCFSFLMNAKDNDQHVSCNCWFSKKSGNLQQINGNKKTIIFRIEE